MPFPVERISSRATTSQLLLRTIYERGPVSRADLSRATGLTAPTVSEVTAGLLAEGLIEESGLGPSTGGKRPTLLRVVDDSRCLIGLDLARGDFRGAVLNLRGEIRQKITLPLAGYSGEAALQLVYRLVDDLLATADRPVLGIGIGAPGLVDASRGYIIDAVNLGWRSLPLAELLQQRSSLPVYAANDCQTAALAEHRFGGGQDSEALVVINTGYGVGAGIVIEGRLLSGSPFGAGEIGHLVVEPGGKRCLCGNRGCLETVASTRGIARRALEQGLLSARLGEIHPPGMDDEQTEMSLLRQLCAERDPAAVQLIRETGRYLGMAAASLVSVLGCCRILFAGSVACFGDTLLEVVREEMDARSFSTVTRQTEIGFVDVGADIVLRGTSVLVLSRELRLL